MSGRYIVTGVGDVGPLVDALDGQSFGIESGVGVDQMRARRGDHVLGHKRRHARSPPRPTAQVTNYFVVGHNVAGRRPNRTSNA